MTRLLLCLTLSLLGACGGVAVEEQTRGVSVTRPSPKSFPDQQEPPRRGSLEEMMHRHADVLEVGSNNTVVLQTQHSEVDIHPEDEELDIFVIQLLRSLGKYEGRGASSGLTLSDIKPVALDEADQGIPVPELSELESAYREVLAVPGNESVRLQVQHRLADILLLEGEAALSGVGTNDAQAYFGESRQLYETLLRENPDDPSNDRVLYQLAKAHALAGQTGKSLAVLGRLTDEYPDSHYVPEAEFRRAESFFTAADYGRADRAYTRVIGYGDSTPYYVKALYMQGWSRLKEGDYFRAIEPLTVTLDRVMPADNDMAAMQRGERELAQDCMRALAVIFSQLEGAKTIGRAYDQLGPRFYLSRLYVQLGDLYLAQERYADSAEVYRSYIRRFPGSGEAPGMQLRVIAAYEAAGFPALVAQQKDIYLEQFRLGGDYWQRATEADRLEILTHQKQFMEEMANYHHALAQQKAGRGDQSGAKREHYLAAIRYYQSFVDSFPQEGRVVTMTFLLGECRFEVGDYPGAISAYESVAYDVGDNEQAVDAAYAALIAYERLEAGEGGQINLLRVASERKFAATFASDPRAVPVLQHASDALLQLGEYEQSAEIAATVIGWQPAPDTGLLTAARLVLGHSLFEMSQYEEAELAYQDALSDMAVEDEHHLETVNRLAASIYRQGELMASAGDYRQAAMQFARVISVAPLSPVRTNAQYDAAMNYIQAGQLEQANSLLLDFRDRFPGHPLATSIGASLVSNYEQLEMWQEAASELDGMASARPQQDRERQALYLSASYYERSGATEQAIARYKNYVKRWPEPFDRQLEAMNRLARLYQESGQSLKRRYWLEKIVVAHDRAGKGQSERSLYLAALSASVLAEHEFNRFKSIKLGYPIKTSIGSKRKAMERAVVAYQKVEAYGVQQFSTLATYRIGGIYQQLATDLMHSDRPDNLDALAMEQYEVLLEEQAYPFEEKAIAIYETNTRRTRQGAYDEWVRNSFTALGELLPARYHKQEKSIGYGGEIY